jgi:hypothetical protein
MAASISASAISARDAESTKPSNIRAILPAPTDKNGTNIDVAEKNPSGNCGSAATRGQPCLSHAL